MLNIGSCYYCSHSPDQWKGFYGYRDIKGILDTFMKIQNIFMDMVIQSLGMFTHLFLLFKIFKGIWDT